MKFSKEKEMLDALVGIVNVTGDQVTVVNEAGLPAIMDDLVYTAVFGDGLVRDTARWLIWHIAQAVDIFPASIHEIYMAVGHGHLPANFTVPAVNVRAANYYTSRAVFRAANSQDVGTFIFEIARSEMGYTDQRPAEYVSCILGAAIREGFRGPVFIQGDHFQISAKNFAANRDKEVQAVKDLIAEAMTAGFYNIDIDTSTLVDLEPETLDEQQRLNYEVCAELTAYARSLQPEGVTVSLGGEIGEVGGHNSNPAELRAFMDGYLRALPANMAGISKISVQTGTSHGGVVLPDGTLADVKVDFDTLRELGRLARTEYGTGGAVQHGASTLPPEAFNKFPQIGTLEIHLATNFQNMFFDLAPQFFVDTAYNYVLSNLKNEWKSGQTEEQFLYSTRKKAIGPLKQMMWDLETAAMDRISQALEDQFSFLFRQLGVYNTRAAAQHWTTPVAVSRPRPTTAVTEDELEIADDLAD
ncbi:MAG: class II fructose-bisphosphate aldolase [Anaerolineales bacterium]|nr:class II fructose-bisphosphate aldolase [Anaerolineales bacterium]MCB8953999.1 class II fructose-bisphosphate aldolase [Ardenticatenales bacterium]